MNYFMSDLFGASNAYFAMKDRMGIRNNDNLYILGNILDGNKRAPENSLIILDDIIKHDNIHLILGNHEYAHVMLYISVLNNDEENINKWKDYLNFEGMHLYNYMENNLSAKEKKTYMDFLIQCEMSEITKIGDKYFYMVHSCPAFCIDENEWQFNVVENPLNIYEDYYREIISDPFIRGQELKIEKKDLFLLTGHTTTREFFENNYGLDVQCYKGFDGTKKEKIIKCGNNFCINCGCKGSSLGRIDNGWQSNLACVGIDAAGYFVEYLL